MGWEGEREEKAGEDKLRRVGGVAGRRSWGWGKGGRGRMEKGKKWSEEERSGGQGGIWGRRDQRNWITGLQRGRKFLEQSHTMNKEGEKTSILSKIGGGGAGMSTLKTKITCKRKVSRQS